MSVSVTHKDFQDTTAAIGERPSANLLKFIISPDALPIDVRKKVSAATKRRQVTQTRILYNFAMSSAEQVLLFLQNYHGAVKTN